MTYSKAPLRNFYQEEQVVRECSPLIHRRMVAISLFLTDKRITFSYCSAKLLILNHIGKIKSCIGKRLEDLKEAKK